MWYVYQSLSVVVYIYVIPGKGDIVPTGRVIGVAFRISLSA